MVYVWFENGIQAEMSMDEFNQIVGVEKVKKGRPKKKGKKEAEDWEVK